MKKYFFTITSLLVSSVITAQVKDISFAVAPTADYVWWHKQAGITNGFMAGGSVGFGFGRNIELLGSYRQSIGLKSKIDGFSAPDAIASAFEATNVNVHRWGGELKGNIPLAYSFQPYVTLGSGVQTVKANNLSEEQVFFGLGLGAKFNLTRRLTLNLEAKATRFNFDASNLLHKSSEARTSAYNQWVSNNVNEKDMFAWSVGAGLQLYLGGRNPNELTELDHSYTNLKSFKVVLEPSLGYLNFSGDSNLRDTYLGGVSAGFDFTEYIGIRGYYYQAMENEKISTNFDKLSLYGGDFLARLNISNGVVPYVSVGAGYMNVGSNYAGRTSTGSNKSGIFAKGGVGLAIPLGKRVELFGVANLLFSTQSDDATAALKSANKLQKNTFYQAGIRIKLAKSNHTEVYTPYTDVTETASTTTVAANNINKTTTPLTQKQKTLAYYNEQITGVEKQIQLALQNGDNTNAQRLLKEKQQWETLRNQYAAENIPYMSVEQVRLVRMTPEELQTLIDNVVKSVKEGEGKSTDQRIDRLEKLLLELKQPAVQPVITLPATTGTISTTTQP